MRIYRLFGGAAARLGFSWTTVDPRTLPDARDTHGLPDANSAEWLAIGDLVNTTGIRQRDALPLDGKRGGAPELLIPSPATQIVIVDIVSMERRND